MRFVLILTLFWILALSAGMTNSFAGENWTYKWLPEEKYVFPAMIADPWETQCWISFNHNYKQYGKIGTRVPLYQAKLQVDPPLSRGMTASEIVQLGVDLLVFESMRYRKAEGGGFDLDTADTKFGAHLEWDLNGDWFFRFLTVSKSSLLSSASLPLKKPTKYPKNSSAPPFPSPAFSYWPERVLPFSNDKKVVPLSKSVIPKLVLSFNI